MANDIAQRAHVLRRLTMAPALRQAAELDGTSPTDLVESLLAAEPWSPDELVLADDDDGYSLLPAWWIEVMLDDRAGLHERMTWFWHTHLTSGLNKVKPALMYRQHRMLREHAMGNVRELLQAVTVDAAMLLWLDGAGSSASSPNQNFGREVMELFALGHGAGYTQADVEAAAHALSGWWVDGDQGDEVRFDPDRGPQQAADLLGRSVSSASEVIDAICDHPACAPWIAGAVHQGLTGAAPDEGRRAELAAVLMANDLDIAPLVADIVRHASFLEQRMNRPRSALEWFLAVRRLYEVELDWWPLDGLGQVPFSPPNVAGWPGDARWVSVGVQLGKAQLAMDSAWDTATLDEADPVGDVLTRACLHEVSDATTTVLREAAASVDDRRARSSLLHALVAVSPEFSIA
ncbi:MAG: DUF1800 family protein [Ilumatobacteraceae bacterium]